MKVKDIISEGFARGFVRGLMPKAINTALGGGRPQGMPSDKELAKQSFQKYGLNPSFDRENWAKSIEHLPDQIKAALNDKVGEISYYTPFQLAILDREVINKEKYAKQQNVQTAQDEIKQSAGASMLSPKPTEYGSGMKSLFKKMYDRDFTGAGQAAPSAPKSAPTTPPPQVRLASGEYITKYGNSWYNEQGQRVVDAASIASLERRAQKPSGQTQMATTKNIPVDLPGYRGKRK